MNLVNIILTERSQAQWTHIADFLYIKYTNWKNT